MRVTQMYSVLLNKTPLFTSLDNDRIFVVLFCCYGALIVSCNASFEILMTTLYFRFIFAIRDSKY